MPGLLKDALNCLDNVTDTDGSLRAMRAKVRKCGLCFVSIVFASENYDRYFNANFCRSPTFLPTT